MSLCNKRSFTKTRVSEQRSEAYADSSANLEPAEDEHSYLFSRFDEYAQAIDSKTEKRERIVKASRDLTMYSKRVISSVHRGSDDSSLSHASNSFENVCRFNLGKVVSELESENDKWMFHSSYSCGIQEFVEAFSFLHFRQTGNLLSLSELNERLREEKGRKGDERKEGKGETESKGGKSFQVTESDYVLGICDLTGELMRVAVSTKRNEPVQNLKGKVKGTGEEEFSVGSGSNLLALKKLVSEIFKNVVKLPKNLDLTGDGISKKLEVMQESVVKIENALYSSHVRLSEFPSEAVHTLSANVEDRMETAMSVA